ncbi:hypothetical protein [Geopsychrobacter electrodiphilus]|uniref:hypothetical protein n=1 Tax=Geopsychrobacter electrodiphilus TaxID=225196 RepID=UPI0003778CAB|nr:hypothetical protein [Geopsychrobacter electrodiphilus]
MPIVVLMLLAALLAGSPSQAATNSPGHVAPLGSHPTSQVMRQSIDPVRLELPSQAPQIWRSYQQEKPALVLFSEHPFLEPIPPELHQSVAKLINQGSAAEFRLHDSLQRAEPLLLPSQTLTAALDQHLFSEVVWYFPAQGKLADFKAENFRKLMSKAGFLTSAEAEKLHLVDEGILVGEVRHTPLRIMHPLAALPAIKHPVILHVDLGYFRGLFKNEISTPVYDLLQETVQLLRDSEWQCLAVTLSYSNEGGNYALATRFLISDLARLLKQPALLDGKMPESWINRKNAMFSQNFFQEKNAKELIQKNADSAPEDPTVQYDLYQLLIQSGKNQAAFAQLDKVVKLDPGYAEEYLALAETGLKNKWDKQTLTLLDKAMAAIPQDPLIPLQKAELLLKLKRPAEAMKIYTDLAKRTWSAVYYPEMANHLRQKAASLTESATNSSAK